MLKRESEFAKACCFDMLPWLLLVLGLEREYVFWLWFAFGVVVVVGFEVVRFARAWLFDILLLVVGLKRDSSC